MKKPKKRQKIGPKPSFTAHVRNVYSALLAQKWILMAIAGMAVLVIAGVLLFSWITRPKNPGIAFYRVPAKLVAAITEKAQNADFSGNTKFTFIQLDDSLPLDTQIDTNKRRISLLFAPAGQAAASLATKVHTPSNQARRLLPTTIRNAGATGKEIYALPILLDHFELSYSKELLSNHGEKPPTTITELVETARKVQTRKIWPMICAGSRDEDLLLLTGTLIHSQYGLDAYMKLVTEIRKDTPFEVILTETRLGDVLETLLAWRRARLLHPQWLEMTGEDLAAFMRFENAVFVFMPLSARRELVPETADKYVSIAVPPEVKASSYPLTAPVYTGIRIRNELFADSTEQFLYALVQEENQHTLSRETGLAPANAKAPSNDKQAYEVRYWAAAARILVPDPVTAAVDSPARMASFAEELRSYIRGGGNLLRQ